MNNLGTPYDCMMLKYMLTRFPFFEYIVDAKCNGIVTFNNRSFLVIDNNTKIKDVQEWKRHNYKFIKIGDKISIDHLNFIFPSISCLILSPDFFCSNCDLNNLIMEAQNEYITYPHSSVSCFLKSIPKSVKWVIFNNASIPNCNNKYRYAIINALIGLIPDHIIIYSLQCIITNENNITDVTFKLIRSKNVSNQYHEVNNYDQNSLNFDHNDTPYIQISNDEFTFHHNTNINNMNSLIEGLNENEFSIDIKEIPLNNHLFLIDFINFLNINDTDSRFLVQRDTSVSDIKSSWGLANNNWIRFGSYISYEQVYYIPNNIFGIVLTQQFFSHYIFNNNRSFIKILFNALPKSIKWIIFNSMLIDPYHNIDNILNDIIPNDIRIYSFNLTNNKIFFKLIKYLPQLNIYENLIQSNNNQQNLLQLNHDEFLSQMNNYSVDSLQNNNINLPQSDETQILNSDENLLQLSDREISSENEENNHINKKRQKFTNKLEKDPHNISSVDYDPIITKSSFLTIPSQNRKRHQLHKKCINEITKTIIKSVIYNKNNKIEIDSSVIFNISLKKTKELYKNLDNAKRFGRNINTSHGSSNKGKINVMDDTINCIELAENITKKVLIKLKDHHSLINKNVYFIFKSKDMNYINGDSLEYRRIDVSSDKLLNYIGGNPILFPEKFPIDPYANIALGISQEPIPQQQNRIVTHVQLPSPNNIIPKQLNRRIPNLNSLGANLYNSRSNLPDHIREKLGNRPTKRKRDENSNKNK